MFPGGIVLTGGGALLRGFAEMVQQVTDLPARVAAPQGVSGMNDEIQGPDHATVVGLLRWAARSGGLSPARRRVAGTATSTSSAAPNPSHDPLPGPAGEPVGERLGRWLRELF